ncbi:DHH family phosphoesterase [Bacillus cereus]|uniref:DHH family phosphoesterase n=1 Tax=Bacillus cereus TaxID=1396 RepID=UPI000BFE23DC|nr:DHH family phosphoesterase [Bacillus cereus]PGR83726.1 hypothetical protein COC63_06980 [Bacillus cereus]
MATATKRTALDIILSKRGMTPADLEERKQETLQWQALEEVVNVLSFEVFMSEAPLKIGIEYDCDVDGLYAGHILEDFLVRFGKPVVRYMNNDKTHGLTRGAVEWAKSEQLDWLFVVDAGSGNLAEMEELTALGMKVVVLDHHPYKRERPLPQGAWVVNPLDDANLPKLSGCGVVYRTIEALGKRFNVMTEMYEKYVGITVISDICDMRDAENRYYVRRAYAEYRANLLFNQFQFYGSYRSFYGYGLIPYLNALIRVGESKRAMVMVSSMHIPAKMNAVKRDVKRVKTRQDEMIAELTVSGHLFETENFVLHLRKQKPELRLISGLTASRLVDKYGKSALVLYFNEETKKWGGSFRGKNFDNAVLQEWGFHCQGHPFACGVTVDSPTLVKFKQEFHLDTPPVQEVDFRTSMKGLKKQTWLTLADFNEMSGAGVPEVVIELKEKVSDAVDIHVVSPKRRDILFEDGLVVVDFTGKEDDIIRITPALAKDGYQFIRK